MTDRKKSAEDGTARSDSWAAIDPETGEPRTASADGDGAPAAAAGHAPRPAQPFSPGELLHFGDPQGEPAAEDGRFSVTIEQQSDALYNPETGEAPAAVRLQRWTVSAQAAREIRRIAEEDAARQQRSPSASGS
jgi:hypothetical protein